MGTVTAPITTEAEATRRGILAAAEDPLFEDHWEQAGYEAWLANNDQRPGLQHLRAAFIIGYEAKMNSRCDSYAWCDELGIRMENSRCFDATTPRNAAARLVTAEMSTGNYVGPRNVVVSVIRDGKKSRWWVSASMAVKVDVEQVAEEET